jgi:hypothetical protein
MQYVGGRSNRNSFQYQAQNREQFAKKKEPRTGGQYEKSNESN